MVLTRIIDDEWGAKPIYTLGGPEKPRISPKYWSVGVLTTLEGEDDIMERVKEAHPDVIFIEQVDKFVLDRILLHVPEWEIYRPLLESGDFRVLAGYLTSDNDDS